MVIGDVVGRLQLSQGCTPQPVGLKLHGHTHERRRVTAKYRSTCGYSSKRIEVISKAIAAIEEL